MSVRDLLCFTLLLGCGTQAPVRPVPLPSELDALRLRCHGHAIARVGDALFALGGFPGQDDDARDVLRFDLPHGPWRQVGKAPISLAFTGAVVYGEDIYCVREGIHRYRPADGTWKSWPLPGVLPRSHHGIALYGGKIHVLGGYPAKASGHVRFTPGSSTLERLAPPPGFSPTDHLHILVVAQGRLHVLGGRTEADGGLSTRHASFDGTRWHAHAALPVATWRKFEAFGVIGRELIVGTRDATHVLDLAEMAWSRHAAMPHWVVMPGCVVDAGALYVLGGREVESGRHAALRFDTRTRTWTGDTK